MTHDLPVRVLRDTLERQYRAALAMLRDAIERCSDALWDDPTPTNAFWQVAYHTLFFTHLYLQPTEADFRPWPGHQGDVQHAAAMDALDLLAAESGFWWYRIPKLEHQLVNLRHLQRHAAQLADRIRAATGDGVAWVSSGPGR